MCLFEIQTKTNLAAQSLVKREENYKSKLYFLNFNIHFLLQQLNSMDCPELVQIWKKKQPPLWLAEYKKTTFPVACLECVAVLTLRAVCQSVSASQWMAWGGVWTPPAGCCGLLWSCTPAPGCFPSQHHCVSHRLTKCCPWSSLSNYQAATGLHHRRMNTINLRERENCSWTLLIKSIVFSLSFDVYFPYRGRALCNYTGLWCSQSEQSNYP